MPTVDCKGDFSCILYVCKLVEKRQIQPEVIDLLSGKVPSPVLTRHYLLPSKDMKNDVLRALEKLQQQL